MQSAVEMEIQKLLEEGKFENEFHRLRVNLIYTSGWLKSRVKAFLAPFEITQQQFNILRILRGVHPEAISTLQIRERMIDRMSDTSRIVDRLVKKDLVEKSPSGADKRLVDVRISDEGLKLLAEIDQEKGDLDAILFGVSADQARMINELLNELHHD